MVGKDEKYLFDLNLPDGESELAKNNLITKFPEVAADLEKRLMAWNATLPAPGLPRELVPADEKFFVAHVKKNGKMPIKNTVRKKGKRGKARAAAADPDENE